SQRGAFTARATKSPRMTTEEERAGSTNGIGTPELATTKPASIAATKLIGQIQIARPPASTAHRPTAIMARMWSTPFKGWATPETKELISTPGCASAGDTRIPANATPIRFDRNIGSYRIAL